VGNIPVLSGDEVVRVFERLGWHVVRRKGSHIIMIKEGQIATLSVPDHKEIAKGTLRSLIRSAKLTTDEFLAAI
jgi:predicted RNA binding protein YcfA (HicA-like mRNA interferase family)